MMHFVYCLTLFFLCFCIEGVIAQQTPPSLDPKPDRIMIATNVITYKLGFEAVIKRYEEIHPNRKIELQLIGPGYETWVRTMFSAGISVAPDIYHYSYTQGFERQGRLVRLNDYIKEINPYTGEVWEASLDMPLMERYRMLGGLFGVHMDTHDIGIFYNKKIFDKLGLSVPANWNELLATCEAIKRAGYIPMAIGGDGAGFWEGQFGWFVRTMTDAYLRSELPYIISQPGDWNYIPERAKTYDPNSSDPFNDIFVDINQERLLLAVKNGILDARTERFRAAYRRLWDLSRYFQEGFMGNDSAAAVQLFYRQRAAMSVLTSGSVSAIARDFEKLDESERFEYGVFWIPPITDDPLVKGGFRGVGGAGVQFGVTRKDDPIHERNVIDFMMYLFSPQSVQLIFDTLLSQDPPMPINGMPAIKGVTLPSKYDALYAPFSGHGYDKMQFSRLEDDQESIYEWSVFAQDFFLGRTTLDTFLQSYQDVFLRAIPRIVSRMGYDLNPTTKDIPPASLDTTHPRRLWNPFENGSLMVGIVILTYTFFALWHFFHAHNLSRSRTLIAYLLLAPTFLLVGIFLYFPAVSGLYLSFTHWEDGQRPVFCGFDNFRRLGSDPFFWYGLRNLIILIVAGVFKGVVVPFIAAKLLLGIVSPKIRYVIRTMFLIPMVVPAMVGILLWKFIYDPSLGLLNQLLIAMDLPNLTANWLGESGTALLAIIFMGFPWIGAFGLLIFMAGLMDIPQSVIEAYRLESQNIFKRMFYIDIPMVRGQTRLLLFLVLIGTLQDFQTFLIMTGGGPGTSTLVPALRMYHQAFRFSNLGYASTIGFVIFVAILMLTIINLKFLKPAEQQI